jgi:hypothetical protein
MAKGCVDAAQLGGAAAQIQQIGRAWCTFGYVTKNPQHVDGLAQWESAMQEVRATERQFEAAQKRSLALDHPLRARLDALRTRADLLLADAVKAMHQSRHDETHTQWGKVNAEFE